MATPNENLTRAEAAARAEVVSDVSYQVHLDLTGDDKLFTADTTITFRATPGDPTFLDCTAEKVVSVELNGKRLPDNVIHDTRISLPSLEAENTVRVVSTMRYQHEGKGLHHFRDPADDTVYLHSQCEPFDAHLIFACFDQPDLKGTFDISVDAPAGWVVVSNSAATSTPEGGQAGRWEFATTKRISTYLFAVVAGGYVAVHDTYTSTTGETIPLGLYARKSLKEFLEVDEIFEVTKQGFAWFEREFDFAYPFGKYDQLFVPEFSAGAMENPGCVTFSEAYVHRSKVTDAARERRAEVILHEMAHMWFGDLVTMRWWDDLWLNESFATFMSVLCQAEATRFTNAWVTFLDAEKTWAKFQDQLPSTHPIAADMVDIESVHQNFDGITYAKGASVLRQLVAWVGQDEFLEGCRRYFAKHAYDNAELKDFLAALEDASGRELTSWTGLWLETTGVNTLAPSYTTGEDGAYDTFSLVQTAPTDHHTIRPHRVAVGLYDLADGTLTRRERVELDVTGEDTAVEALIGKQAADAVVVNDDDLTYTKLLLDPTTTATITDHLGDFDEDMPRALLWSATWDMVRDAQLKARTFAEMVRNNVEGEGDIGVLQRLLQRAAAAIERYGDPANAEPALEALAVHARGALERAEPSSDEQLAWARHWASTAGNGSQAADVEALLAGDLAFDGLEVDTDLRWHLVIALASSGRVDVARIDEELAQDPTDLGERSAATAKAALPTAAQKQEAFDRLLNDDGLSHTMTRQVIAGFNRLGHADVLAPFVDQWFDALPTVWSSRSQNWATEWTDGMFPHHAASPQLLDRLDETLRGDLRAPARRSLMEQRDTLLRTIAARELDAS